VFAKLSLIGSALVTVLVQAPLAARAQALPDSEKIERLQRQTDLLQKQLKALQEEIRQTKKRAEGGQLKEKGPIQPAAYSTASSSTMTKGNAPAAMQESGGKSSKSGVEDTKGNSVGAGNASGSAVSWHGITLYGTLDVQYAYQTNGVPFSGALYTGLETNPVTTSRNFSNRSISTLSNSGLAQSKIGLNIQEPLDYGWSATGQIEVDFNPLSGELADACASMVRNNGVPLTRQDANTDGSRCGQAFSGPVYAGVSNATYGTLTAGRQQSLQLDALFIYDPMALSYAFSLLGYSGTNAGAGDTEAARWDNSAKYLYQYGPVHAAAMYSVGGQDTAMFGGAYGFNVGGAYGGFSIDAIYTNEKGAVAASPIPFSTTAVTALFPSLLACNAIGIGDGNACPAGRVLAATISDNVEWSVMGKYTFDFGGGLKDEGSGAKLTLFGGYTYIDQANPEKPIEFGTTIGGYRLLPSLINNNAFFTDRIFQYFWTGATYALPSGWSFTGAYYYQNQNTFVAGTLTGVANGTTVASVCTAGGSTRANCSGNVNQGAFLADYQVNKHFDVYAGVSYVQVDGGFAAGFPGVSTTFGSQTVDTTVFMTGARLQF
jgi:predicted porin